MKIHMKSHSDAKKSFVCEICKQVFFKIDHLIVHQRTHTGQYDHTYGAQVMCTMNRYAQDLDQACSTIVCPNMWSWDLTKLWVISRCLYYMPTAIKVFGTSYLFQYWSLKFCPLSTIKSRILIHHHVKQDARNFFMCPVHLRCDQNNWLRKKIHFRS